MLTMPNDTSEIGLLDILKAVCVPERSREKNSCIIQVLSIYKTDVFYPMSERGLSETGLIHYLRCHLVNLTTQFQSVRDQISSVNETINLINHSNSALLSIFKHHITCRGCASQQNRFIVTKASLQMTSD